MPNLTDELSTAKERRLNQFGTAVLVWSGKSVKFDRVCRTFVQLNLGSTHGTPSESDVAPVSLQSRTYSVRFGTWKVPRLNQALIPHNTNQYNDQGWTNQLMSHDVINLSLILYSFPAAGTFVTGKKQFSDGQNSWNFLGDTFKTVRIVNYTNLKTKISLCCKKMRVIYTSSKSFIFFTMNRRFIFSTIWSPITHTILKKKKRKTLKKREKITSSWIIQIIYKKTHFNSNWNQNKSYLTIYQEISHLKYYSMILFKSLPLRLRILRDRTSQVTCQKDIY